MWQRVQHSIQRLPSSWLWGATAIVALYLSLGVVLGFDVCDTGQYLTMYANMLQAPDTVGYHFMYYLSGLVGGALMAVMPLPGVLGMRLVGLLCIVLCMFTVWRILKPYLSPAAIVAGNVLSMVAFVALPLAFCYDLLSITLYLFAIEQLLKKRALPMLAGGFLLGINAFTRIPNVLGFTFVLIPMLMAWCTKASLKTGASRSALALVGTLTGVAAMAGLMAAMGHLHIFSRCLASLQQVASDHSGESSHSALSLMMVNVKFYVLEFYTWFKLASVIGIYTVLRRRIPSPPVRFVLLCGALAATVWMMWRMFPLQPIWALCCVGCITMIWLCEGEKRGVAIVALALMLIFPMGSDGMFNNGSIILMLATPLAIGVCMEHTRMFRTGWFVVAFALVCVAKTATDGAYFDGGALWHKTAAIQSPKARGVRTTAERAAIINDALSGIRPWVHEGDTLLVYGSMPMLNYLTDTRPAFDCCWPEMLTSAMLTQRLDTLSAPPKVLRQKFVSIGSHFTAPTDSMLHTYGAAQSVFCVDTKIEALNRFLATRHYQKVWESPHFILYLPTE